MLEDKKECQKLKLPEVEHLLHYLANRKTEYVAQAKTKLSEKPSDPGAFESTEIDEQANIVDVEDYMELLYEDIPEKVHASALILQLARNPDNLEELFNNETLIGALARVLKEDWKSSYDLSINIIYVFFCFSSFSNFHPVIAHFRIGAQVMTVLEHELQKYEMWKEELARKRQAAAGSGKDGKRDLEKATRKFKTLVKKQEQLFRVSFYMLLNISEELSVEVKMKAKGIVPMLCRTLDRDNYELQILIVSFIKKLSIFKENIDELLKVNVMERLHHVLKQFKTCDDLLNITLRLILNLTFDRRMRAQLVKIGMLQTLMQYMIDKQRLRRTSMLDQEMRRLFALVKHGWTARGIKELPTYARTRDELVIENVHENHKNIVLCILYHVSHDDEHKAKFFHTDCVSLLVKLITESREELIDIEVMSLAVNLACDPTLAEVLAGKDGKGIRIFMKRAFRFKDSVLMKMLRNISEHESEKLKMLFVNYISDLGRVIVDPGDYGDDFALECLGILANLNIPDLDFRLIIEEYDLVEWIRKQLQPGAQTPDDVVLQVIILVGTICNDDSCARLLAEAQVVQTLIELLNAKQEDDEVVCQIVFVFYQLIFHETTRNILIKETQAPAYLIDLMHDKNVAIRQVCDLTLDIISEFDPDWGRRIQLEKFKWHNSQWLDMMEGGQPAAGPGLGGVDDFDPRGYDGDEALNHPELFYGDDLARVTGAATPDMIYPGDEGPPRPYDRPPNGMGFSPMDATSLADQAMMGGLMAYDEFDRPISADLLDQYQNINVTADDYR
uniref:Kinesin-associated protein 3 n=1 Tax=Macrostomum lignano TaxID=282301 RepID=A0A1I8GKV7_9PLAT